MLLKTCFPAILLALAPAVADAWSMDVHQQIGFMAEKFLHPRTVKIISQILEPEYEGSLGNAAAWADPFVYTPEGAFTRTWHWIDASDAAPSSCNVHLNRDCSGTGCLVSAIANHTQRFASCVERAQHGSLKNGLDLECSRSLKFLAHFIGDITQPLHTSGLAAGGNLYSVTFAGSKTNLHSVWDGRIIRQLANVNTFDNSSITPFFAESVKKTRRDAFSDSTRNWLSCNDPSTPVACALAWARDTNEWNCDYTYSQIFNDTDLATSGYAEGAYPIVELQTAKSGLRLAQWLNAIVKDGIGSRDIITSLNPSWALGPMGGV